MLIIIAKQFADIAELKGHNGNPYFWFTFILGAVGMLMVIALPAVSSPTTQHSVVAPTASQAMQGETATPKPAATHSWRCDDCGNMRSQTPCEHCGHNENKPKAPYKCGKCGHEGPYEEKCPSCGSSIKFYNH